MSNQAGDWFADREQREREQAAEQAERAYHERAQARDNVNHPAHYTAGGIECIDALKAATEGLHGIQAVCAANAIKYVWRFSRKNGAEDIEKAIWYLQRLLQEIRGEARE